MSRYFRRGLSKVLFLPAVAVKAAPTRAELTAGTPLTPQLAEMANFELTNSPIPTPDLDTTFTTTITGEDTTGGPTLTFYDDTVATTIRTALLKGTAGYVVLLPYGDVPTKRAEVWPVKSGGVNDQWSAGNDPARYVVALGVTGVPEQNAVVPA